MPGASGSEWKLFKDLQRAHSNYKRLPGSDAMGLSWCHGMVGQLIVGAADFFVISVDLSKGGVDLWPLRRDGTVTMRS